MLQEIQILSSKTRYWGSDCLIPRARLFPLFEEIRQKRLTTVIAGAGYGKSTLLFQATESLKMPVSWYRFDSYDTDLKTFLFYLIDGLRKHFPEFGRRTLEKLAKIPDSDKTSKNIQNSFLREIDQFVTEDIIVVLDDFHEVNESKEICQCVTYLLENMSSQMHLIISSRTEPNLPLSLLRARRQVFEIKEPQLAFSIREIEQLFLQVFQLHLQKPTLETLWQKTQGWVSALILFYHALQKKNPEEIENLLVKLIGSHVIISEYLEENVYHLQQPEIRDFLLKTSILERIHIKFCNHFLEISNSSEILEYLETRHLFTYQMDSEGQWYRYHQLFQDFLYKRLVNNMQEEKIRRLHVSAAVTYERQGEFQEALRHYLQGHDFEKASILIYHLSNSLTFRGQLHLMQSYLRNVPEKLINRHPWLQSLQAQAYDLFGKRSEAIWCFEKAYKRFVEQKSINGIGLCIEALGRQYLSAGDIHKAIRFLKTSLTQAKGTVEYISSLGTLSLMSVLLGEQKDADQYFAQANSLLASIENDEQRISIYSWVYFSRGFRFIVSGDFSKALGIGMNLKAKVEEAGYDIMATFSYIIISYACFFLGDFDQGFKEAQAGINLMQRKQIDTFLTYPLLLSGSSLNAMGLRKKAEAIKDVKQGLQLSSRSENPWGRMFGYYTLYAIHKAFDNPQEAETALKACLAICDELNLPIDKGIAGLFGPVVETAPAGLRVFCFGRFKLFKGDEEIRIEKWKSKKAIAIFKYLLLTRARGYKSKEILMEWLWPEKNPKQVVNRFYVTMHNLRKSLEPDLKKGMKSAYIISHEDAYRLDLGADGAADIDVYAQEIKNARQKRSDPKQMINHLVKAEKMYTGELFEEDPYADWCAREREYYKSEYLKIVKEIMAYYRYGSMLEKCIEYAQKYLVIDKYGEEVYRLLMELYDAQGNRAMVTMIYETCKQNIVNDLSCELSPRTQRLYEKLSKPSRIMD